MRDAGDFPDGIAGVEHLVLQEICWIAIAGNVSYRTLHHSTFLRLQWSLDQKLCSPLRGHEAVQ